jgi:hypothetical protein
MELYHGKTVEYWKQNAEEDYMGTPISVLKYITVLEEQAKQLGLKKGFTGSEKCECIDSIDYSNCDRKCERSTDPNE